MTALFHLNIELDHRDQLEPIADDLRDRYGVSNLVWYEIIDGPPEYELVSDEDDGEEVT